MIRKLVFVATNVVGGQGAGPGKEGVDVVPGQACPFVAVTQVVDGSCLRKFICLSLRGAGQMPGIPLFHADGDFGAFKIIDVGRSFFFNNTGVTRYKVGKLGFEADRGGGLGLHQRQLVDEGGDEVRGRVPRSVEAPYRVGDGLIAKAYFLRERSLTQVHDGGAYIKVFAETVVEMGRSEEHTS